MWQADVAAAIMAGGMRMCRMVVFWYQIGKKRSFGVLVGWVMVWCGMYFVLDQVKLN